MSIWDTLKRTAYHGGILPLFHQARNQRHLTVVMFHRVLATHDQRWPLADPGYTVSPRLFDECLSFFERHYTVVDLHAVIAARKGTDDLPSRPLLITFDDGWADNAEYALPLLRRRGLPALVFVVSSAVGSRKPFWHEVLRSSWRSGSLDPRRFERLWMLTGGDVPAPPAHGKEESLRALIERLRRLGDDERTEVLSEFDAVSAGQGAPRAMLSREQLDQLTRHCVSIGCHGLTHTSLTEVEQPEVELRMARQALARMSDNPGFRPVAMSFPNGRYSPQAIRAARTAGF